MLRALTSFFLSLKTASTIFFIFLLLCLIGSLSLTKNLAFFSGIDDEPLFRWLKSAGSPSITWWIYGLIVSLSVLAISTVFCTIKALLKGALRGNVLLKLSPQIMHIGVLFVMLGHLLTASAGFKIDVLIKKGQETVLPNGERLRLEDVQIMTDQYGNDTDWIMKFRLIEKESKGYVLQPARPIYKGGIGLYLKAVSTEPEPSATIRVSQDPGALWALFGGLLLFIGGLGFLIGRFGS